MFVIHIALLEIHTNDSYINVIYFKALHSRSSCYVFPLSVSPEEQKKKKAH